MRVLMVAGEASGDAHAAPVARRLQEAGAEVVAVGGPALAAAGVEIVAGIEALSVLGFVPVARRLPELLRLARRLETRLQRQHFDLFLPVDYPGFNLRFAARARRAGVPVVHYIGPQVWAWRAGRLATLRRVANHVALVLPFEKPLYDAAGVPATWVGHPLVDAEVGAPARLEPTADIGLFPGSRPQELAHHLPLLLATAAELRRRRPGLQCLVARAPAVGREQYERHLQAFGFDAQQTLVDPPARDVMSRCRALLVASGTATLEAALAERPFAVLYRTGNLEWQVVRRLVHVQHASLVNLVAGRLVVREYLQGQATIPALVAEAERLLDDTTERARLTDGMREVRAKLGPPGAAARVTALALRVAHEARVVAA